MANHYIRINDNEDIIYGFTDEFETPLVTDIFLYESDEIHFEIDDVENPDLIDDNGIYLYKYIDGIIIKKTDEDIATEIANTPISDTGLQITNIVLGQTQPSPIAGLVWLKVL